MKTKQTNELRHEIKHTPKQYDILPTLSMNNEF